MNNDFFFFYFFIPRSIRRIWKKLKGAERINRNAGHSNTPTKRQIKQFFFVFFVFFVFFFFFFFFFYFFFYFLFGFFRFCTNRRNVLTNRVSIINDESAGCCKDAGNAADLAVIPPLIPKESLAKSEIIPPNQINFLY